MNLAALGTYNIQNQIQPIPVFSTRRFLQNSHEVLRTSHNTRTHLSSTLHIHGEENATHTSKQQIVLNRSGEHKLNFCHYLESHIFQNVYGSILFYYLATDPPKKVQHRKQPQRLEGVWRPGRAIHPSAHSPWPELVAAADTGSCEGTRNTADEHRSFCTASDFLHL